MVIAKVERDDMTLICPKCGEIKLEMGTEMYFYKVNIIKCPGCEKEVEYLIMIKGVSEYEEIGYSSLNTMFKKGWFSHVRFYPQRLKMRYTD